MSISTRHRASAAHLLAEAVVTFGLLVLIFALARTSSGASAPAAVGAHIGAAYFFTSSSGFATPAFTVGRVLSDSIAGIAPSAVPAFALAQLAGAGAAAATPRVLYPQITPEIAARVTVPHTDRPAAGRHQANA